MKKLIIIAIVCISLCGCDKKSDPVKPEWRPDIPKEATEWRSLGCHWYEFTYDGRRFLYLSNGIEISAVTQIQDIEIRD